MYTERIYTTHSWLSDEHPVAVTIREEPQFEPDCFHPDTDRYCGSAFEIMEVRSMEDHRDLTNHLPQDEFRRLHRELDL